MATYSQFVAICTLLPVASNMFSVLPDGSAVENMDQSGATGADESDADSDDESDADSDEELDADSPPEPGEF